MREEKEYDEIEWDWGGLCDFIETEDEGTEGDGKEKPDPVAPAEEENLDEEISLAAQNMPSSLGFTFLVSSDI